MPLAIGLAQVCQLLLIGAAAGLFGGLLGIGGGIVMIPALTLLFHAAYGPNSIHTYKLAAIATSLVLSVPAVIRHHRARAIVFGMQWSIVPASLVGVVLGVLLAGTFIGDHAATLRRIFGAFLEFIVLLNAFQDWRARRGEPSLCTACPMPRHWLRIGTIVGVPAGFIAGMLGIGGGVWAVPAQRLLLGVNTRPAIANSAFMIIFVSIGTAISLSLSLLGMDSTGHLTSGGWWLALWLAPGALLGGWFGGALTHKLPVFWLRQIFQLLLIYAGIRLIVG